MFLLYLILFFFFLGLFRLILFWWRLRQVFRAARFKQNDRQQSQGYSQQGQSGHTERTGESKSDSRTKKKVIGDEEGDYIEFEEVK